MHKRAFLIHALTPLHAGIGQTASVIDLPIARMCSTGIPILPGSSIKGVLREASREALGSAGTEKIYAVFGPEKEEDTANAGALVVGDGRLLALPVRSFSGTFAWVSSPLLLALARRNLGNDWPAAPAVQYEETKHRAHVGALTGADGSVNVLGSGDEARVYLEDLDLVPHEDAVVASWAQKLGPLVGPANRADLFVRRFLVVDDEMMTFLWETCTQVDTRVRIDHGTRTVAKGALWTEESLPPESLLVGLLAADRSRRPGNAPVMDADAVLDFALAKETPLQFGGKATVGRGQCRMIPVGKGA